MYDTITWEIHNDRAFALNPVLLREQNITPSRYREIVETHRLKFDLLDAMAAIDSLSERDLLRGLADMIDDLEYVQQGLWGFPLDPNFHMFWIVPHCICPKQANIYLYGTIVHINAPDCPIHSGSGEIVMEINHNGCAPSRG